MRYQAFDREAKVIGQAMLGFKAAANQEIIEPLMKDFGLTDIQADQWYLQQNWLDVLSKISENAGDYASMLTFVNVGEKVAQNIYFPDQFETYIRQIGFIEFMLRHSSETYYRDHQGQVGKHIARAITDKHLRFELTTPYPPDFWYGIFYGSAKRYTRSFVIQYEDISMRHYMSGETIAIHIIVE